MFNVLQIFKMSQRITTSDDFVKIFIPLNVMMIIFIINMISSIIPVYTANFDTNKSRKYSFLFEAIWFCSFFSIYNYCLQLICTTQIK